MERRAARALLSVLPLAAVFLVTIIPARTWGPDGQPEVLASAEAYATLSFNCPTSAGAGVGCRPKSFSQGKIPLLTVANARPYGTLQVHRVIDGPAPIIVDHVNFEDNKM